ncbi:hypothetical protein KKE48_04040 [Patescibacteria group bacterium]|nr:hypothetical protein [Patescibacteria group bacterium]MBU1500009.1 hypothetical protein [Patescibacteria group bacterium]
MTQEKTLVEGVRVKIQLATAVKEGVEEWRVILDFISDQPFPDQLIKEYYVWVSGEYLKDKAHLTADIESAGKFALDLAQKRFKASDNQVPVENGIYCSEIDGEVIVDPKSFTYPLKKDDK